MLILGRELEQSIVVTHKPTGQRMTLTVTSFKHWVMDGGGYATKVRLGFEAGDEFEINRGEIQTLKDAERKAEPQEASQ